MEERMDLKRFFRIIKRRWITLFITIFCVFSLTVSSVLFLLKPTYEATEYILIGKLKGENYYGEVQEINMLLASTMDFITSQIVLNSVGNEFKIPPEKLEEKITLQNNKNSQIINIVVRDSDPTYASQLSKSIAETTVLKMNESLNVNEVRVLINTEEFSIKEVGSIPLNLVIGFIVSLFIGIGVVMLREYWDDSIREDKEIEKIIGLQLLGVVDLKSKHSRSAPLRTIQDPQLLYLNNKEGGEQRV